MKHALIVGALLALACGGKSEGGGGSGAAGTGGTSGLSPRVCDTDAPCEAGAVCTYNLLENNVACECDASGHWLCDTLTGGAAGPSYSCIPHQTCPLLGASDPTACTSSNHFCTRSCTCQGNELGCSVTCGGSGPEVKGRLCNLSTCSSELYFACSVKSGSCDYQVSCYDHKLTGSCP